MALRARQLVQPVFIHQRHDLRQLDHLMPYGVRIVANQGRPARAALRRMVIIHTPALLDRIESALMGGVTRLSTALPATRPA